MRVQTPVTCGVSLSITVTSGTLKSLYLASVLVDVWVSVTVVKGGEKVGHHGGGIVYHQHDGKELNWEQGWIRGPQSGSGSGVGMWFILPSVSSLGSQAPHASVDTSGMANDTNVMASIVKGRVPILCWTCGSAPDPSFARCFGAT